jgi:hypothetical protein
VGLQPTDLIRGESREPISAMDTGFRRYDNRVWTCQGLAARRAQLGAVLTPAMAMGIKDHIWTIGELLDVTTAEPMEQQAA